MLMATPWPVWTILSSLQIAIWLAIIPLGTAQRPGIFANVPLNGWIYDHTSPNGNNRPINHRGFIRCIGPRDSTIIPDSFTGQSILEFCAAPNYGGRWADNIPENSAGAFCDYLVSPSRVAIYQPYGVLANRGAAVQDFKIWHYCQTKCFCARRNGMTPSLEQTIINSNRGLPRGSHEKYTITSVDGLPRGLPQWLVSYVTDGPQRGPNYGGNNVRHPIPIFSPTQPYNLGSENVNPQDTSLRKLMISGSEENAIYCEGRLPQWVEGLPHSYDSVHRMCAANFQGGHPVANFGGICADPFRGGLAFEQAFAHPDLSEPRISSPNGRTSQLSWSALLWCLSHCACGYQPRKNMDRWPISTSFRGLGEVIIGDNDEVSLRRQSLVGGVLSMAYQSIIAVGSNCIQTSMKTSTPRFWCFKPKPSDIDLTTLTVQPKGWSNLRDIGSQPKCGLACESNLDCDVTSNKGCRCQAKPIKETISPLRETVVTYGLTASCLLLRLTSSGSEVVNPSGKVRRRQQLGGGEEETEVPWCACNATYVSAGCCDSIDGLIWEDGRLRIGELVR